MTFMLYTGAGELYRRTAFAYAFTAGVKVQGLPMEQRPFKKCYQCQGPNCRKCHGKPVRMAGGVWLNTRLFAKKFRSDRKANQRMTDAVRPLAPEFEDFNGVLEPDLAVLQARGGDYDRDHPPPTGSGVLRANLASSHPNGDDDGTLPPGWNQHLRAHKLGGLAQFGDPKRDASLEDGQEGVNRESNPEPNGGAECQGDGHKATRWMNGSHGWDHYEIPCPASKCVFAPVCKVRTTINLMTDRGLGQYQSNGRDTGAGALGFFGTLADPGRIVREANELGISSLYGLPVMLAISAKTKGAGIASFGGHQVQLKNRRFPVVDIVEAMSLPEFAHHQAQMLTGRTQIALPPAPQESDLIEADRDLMIDAATSEPAARPGSEAVAKDGEAQQAADVPAADPGGGSDAVRPPGIGKEGAEKLGDFIRKKRLEAAPKVIPQTLSEVASRAGVRSGVLPEDYTEDEAKAMCRWASAEAKKMPRSKP